MWLPNLKNAENLKETDEPGVVKGKATNRYFPAYEGGWNKDMKYEGTPGGTIARPTLIGMVGAMEVQGAILKKRMDMTKKDQQEFKSFLGDAPINTYLIPNKADAIKQGADLPSLVEVKESTGGNDEESKEEESKEEESTE